MSVSRFYVCAVPGPVWQQPANQHGYGADIAHFVADALGCERRIAKEVNLENEYSRYTLCCQRLEQEILLSGRLKFITGLHEFDTTLRRGRFPAQVLHPGYLVVLSHTLDQSEGERSGVTFFPPDRIGKHRATFSQLAAQQGHAEMPVVRQRLSFLEAAERTGCGVVEIQTSFHMPTERESELEAALSYSAESGEESGQFVAIPDSATERMAIEFFGRKGRKQHLARILRKQIREALESGEPVAFGNQAPHDVITEVLNEFVFVPEGEVVRPVEMRVIYADGSEAEPFPLLCLPRMPAEARDGSFVSPLRVALMSMRHLELDPEIDFCWFRNREVSRTRTLAETDQFCFDTTLAQLRDSLALGDLLLHMYHTGFESAVIGFYRGVVKTLLDLRDRQGVSTLSVIPFYYRGGTRYQAGNEWC